MHIWVELSCVQVEGHSQGILLCCSYWIHTALAAAALTHSLGRPTRHHSLYINRHDPAFKRRCEQSNMTKFTLAAFLFWRQLLARDHTSKVSVSLGQNLNQKWPRETFLHRHHMAYLLATLRMWHLFIHCSVQSFFFLMTRGWILN